MAEITSLDQATDAMIAAGGDDTTTDSEIVEVPEQPEGDTHTPAEWSRLMKESQANRERAQQYEKLYGGASQLKDLHAAAQAYADGDPSRLQEQIILNAAAVFDLSVDDFLAKFEEPEDPEEDDRPLTKRELKEYLKSQQQAQLAEVTTQQRDEIIEHAQSLGYEPGTVQYRRLLDLAMYETRNDLDAAHNLLEGESKAAIDAYIKTQREKARESLRPAPTARIPGTDRAITDGAKNSRDVWNNAYAAGDEFLSATT